MIKPNHGPCFWGNQSPIGRRVRPAFTDPWRTVVGVVADVKNAGVDQPTGTELYLPYQQPLDRNRNALVNIVVRSLGDPVRFAGAVQSQVHALDPSLPVASVRTMDDLLSVGRSRPRFLTLLLTLFSAVSLVLAALGIYGVVSYSVSQRTGEIGLRMAMGAGTRDILRMVLGHGMLLAFAGIIAGAVGAVAVTRFLRGFLFGISSLDILTFATMALVLLSVMLLACYFPALRATKVDPMVALRYE